MSGPHNLEAEQGVLGAVLFNNALMAHAPLDARHFYDPTHGALWTEMRQRYRAGQAFDGVTLQAFAAGTFKEIGGVTYLMKLLDAAAPISAQVVAYADLIRDLSRRRAVIQIASEAAALAASLAGDADAEDIQNDLERGLQDIAAGYADADAWERLGDVAADSVERAELGETAGISTGISRLDALTGGIKPGTLWVAGGATSMGKSIAGAFLGRAIAKQGFGVAEAHLEMDREQIGLRTASALAFENDHRADNPRYLDAQRGRLKPAQWASLRDGARDAARLPIYVDARPGRTLSQIEAAARRLFRQMRRQGVTPGALLIDHEGLIAPEPGARFPSQLERTNARSEGLLAMAKRLKVAIIALSQITKEGSRADGEDRLPNATDLNYGGAISQAASVVLLVHRKAYFEERKPEHLQDPSILKSREATLVVDKVRGGQRGLVKVLIDAPTAAVWEERR